MAANGIIPDDALSSRDALKQWASTASFSDLTNPQTFVGLTSNQLQDISAGLQGYGGGEGGGGTPDRTTDASLMNGMAAAQQQGNPDTFNYLQATANQGSGFKGFTKDLSNGVQSTVANFVAPAATFGLSTLGNKVWSKDAQSTIDPGLQGVSATAGAGAYAGAGTTPAAATDPSMALADGSLPGAAPIPPTAGLNPATDPSMALADGSVPGGTPPPAAPVDQLMVPPGSATGTGATAATEAANPGTLPITTPPMGPLGTALTTAGVNIAATAIGGALAPKPDPAAANAANSAAQIAQDQWNYYKTNYQPLETSLISQAQELSTPEAYAAAKGRANADVTGAFDTANKTTNSRLQSYGINPGSPAYQSAVGSEGLAQGAAGAGAQTEAYNTQKQLALNTASGVVGIGRNIPGSATTGLTSAANAANNASNTQFNQNTQSAQNIGAAISPLISPLVGAAKDWYGSTTPSTTSPGMNVGVPQYASGGKVIDAAKQPDGSYAVPGLEPLLAKKGINPVHAKTASNIQGYKSKIITPHMRFASGGGVGRQGLETRDMSNMGDPSQSNQVVQGPGTGTSDSIPAQVDGQHAAALSNGEFVMNAEVPKLSGDEILAAINNAGLQKRQQMPMPSAQMPANAGAQSYANGGKVKRIEDDEDDDDEDIQITAYRNGGKVNYSRAGL
jgi:hypothetical protein